MYEVNMYSARRILITLLLLGMFLTSCGGQSPVSPTPDVNAILTAAIGTAAESIFQTQTAIVPPATETFTPTAVPTNTALALSTPTALPSATQPVIYNTLVPSFTPIVAPIVSPTGTQYTPTVNPTALGVGCNNLRLIGDVTIPAGTVLKPRETFTKTWKVENNGTCDWVYLYHFEFVSGESMGGGPERLGKIISPGKWTQISLGLEAPKDEGTYTGTWRFADPDGNVFGSNLTVSIVVRR